jgi:hypothetical protein
VQERRGRKDLKVHVQTISKLHVVESDAKSIRKVNGKLDELAKEISEDDLLKYLNKMGYVKKALSKPKEKQK